MSVNQPHTRRHVHGTSAGRPVASAEQGAGSTEVGRGWSVGRGGPGRCVGWVIFHGEFVPRGLLDVPKLPGLPLPQPLRLRRDGGTGPLSRLGGTAGLGQSWARRKSRARPGCRPPGQPAASPCTAGHRDPATGPAATQGPVAVGTGGAGSEQGPERSLGRGRAQRGAG